MSALPLVLGDSRLATGDVIERENPAQPSVVVGAVHAADAALTDQAVEAADNAFAGWADLTPSARASMLHDAADLIRNDAATLGDLLTRELGKAHAGSVGEAAFSALYLDQAADDAVRLHVDSVVENRFGRSTITRRPYGVTSAIVPWNAPLILAMLKVGPALATGNTMVVKPSPLCPIALTTALTTIADALPPGVLNVVNGGADVGRAMTVHPAVRKVAFTGGLETARHVMASAAEGVKPVVLELGGNDPAIVVDVDQLSDADLETMIAATYATSGQVCIAIKRIYVPNGQLGAFADRFVGMAETIVRTGDPLDPDTTMGPVVTRQHADFISELTQDATDRGGSVVTVGTTHDDRDPDGYWVDPTIVTSCPDDARIVVEEQFGPTVPILGYDDINDAVQRANNSELGLAASVWGSDEAQLTAVARRLEVGTTFLNSHNRFGVNPGVPFGGTKQSGFGREYGDAGVEAYLQTHAINSPAGGGSGGYPVTNEESDDE